MCATFVVAVAAYWFLRLYLFDYQSVHPALQIAVLTAALIAASPLRYTDLSPGAGLMLRGLMVMWVVYVTWRSLTHGFVVSDTPFPSWDFFGLWITPGLVWIAAAVAWWRPGFAIAVFVCSLWQFTQFGITSGLPIQTTVDFYVTVEVSVFFIVLTVASMAVDQIGGQPLQRTSDEFKSIVFLVALTAHLGNYFYAGFGKLLLAEPLTWLLQNPTGDLMLGTAAQGVTPVMLVPSLFQATYDLVSRADIALNTWVLGIQLFGLVAVWRRKWLLAALLMYDVLHIGIYFLTGIMFWKWVVLNTLAIIAVRRDVFPVSRLARGLLIAMVLLSTAIFNITWLAWFDSKAVNVFNVHAAVRRGPEVEWVRVPSNYFATHSFNFSANWHYRPGGLLPTSHFGVAFDHDSFVAGRDCKLKGPDKTEWELAPNVEQFVREHHARVVSAWNHRPGWRFDRHPHHIWSMPSQFAPFYEMDPRDIHAYRLSVDAKCLGLRDGQLVGPVLATHSSVISID
jgi:hypothetical protein